MKKNLFTTVITILLLSFLSCASTSSNSGNSTDWAGVYTGIIPSAGGMGINVKITLNADETYKVEYQYVGKSDEIFTSTGTFTWNPARDTIILDSGEDGGFPSYYLLYPNILIQLDTEGNVITSEFNYILKKQ